MHQIKIFKVLFLYLVAHLIVFLNNMVLSDGLSEESCHEREESHLLSLIIKNLDLVFPTANVLELPSDCGISNCDGKGGSQVGSGIGNQHDPDHQHGRVEHPQIALDRNCSFPINTDKSL